MQLYRGYFLLVLFTAMSIPSQAAENVQATIIDTGSTNRPDLQITIDANGNARAESRGVEPHAVELNSRLCRRFLSSLQSAAPLSALPAAHCMKSASFGSRLFIEYNGERTPDLSCPVQSDPKVDDLKKQATEIMATAKAALRPRSR